LIVIACDYERLQARPNSRCQRYFDDFATALANTKDLHRLDEEVCVFRSFAGSLVCFPVRDDACLTFDVLMTDVLQNSKGAMGDGSCEIADMIEACVPGFGPICRTDVCYTGYLEWLRENDVSEADVSYDDWKNGAVIEQGSSGGEESPAAEEGCGDDGSGYRGATQGDLHNYCLQKQWAIFMGESAALDECTAVLLSQNATMDPFRSQLFDRSSCQSDPLAQGELDGFGCSKDQNVQCATREFAERYLDTDDFKRKKQAFHELWKAVTGGDPNEFLGEEAVKDVKLGNCGLDQTLAACTLWDPKAQTAKVRLDKDFPQTDPDKVEDRLFHEYGHVAGHSACEGSEPYCSALVHFTQCVQGDEEACQEYAVEYFDKNLSKGDREKLDAAEEQWFEKENADQKYCMPDDIDCLGDCSMGGLSAREWQDCSEANASTPGLSPLDPYIYPTEPPVDSDAFDYASCVESVDDYRTAQAQACAEVTCLDGGTPEICSSGVGCCCRGGNDSEYATSGDSTATSCVDLIDCPFPSAPKELGNGCVCE